MGLPGATSHVMQSLVSPILFVAVLVVILALAAIVIAFRVRDTTKHSGLAVAVSALPAVMMLCLFYSLAVHMHHSLGAWPSSIGERGFPAALITHANIAKSFFSILVLISIFASPLLFLLCFFVRGWRATLYYLGVYALSCLICFGIMLLAPAQFLYWWWD